MIPLLEWDRACKTILRVEVTWVHRVGFSWRWFKANGRARIQEDCSGKRKWRKCVVTACSARARRTFLKFLIVLLLFARAGNLLCFWRRSLLLSKSCLILNIDLYLCLGLQIPTLFIQCSMSFSRVLEIFALPLLVFVLVQLHAYYLFVVNCQN